MCIAHKSKADMDKVMHVVCSTKQKGKSLKTEKLFANITYYKLRAKNTLATISSAWEIKATELAALKKSSIKRS